MVEGEDLPLLSIFYDKLFARSEDSLNSIPNMFIGGWSGWPYAIGSSMLARNSIGEEIAVYCVLDSDYHTQGEIDDRYAEAKSRHVRLHVWAQKEIENYVIDPEVLARVIEKRKRMGGKIDAAIVASQLNSIYAGMADDIQDCFAEQLRIINKTGGSPAANKAARVVISKRSGSLEGRLSLASGKAILSSLSGWAKATYGVSFNAQSVAREFKKDEIPDEMVAFLGGVHGLSEMDKIRNDSAKYLEN